MRLLAIIVALLFSFSSQAQILNPVKWDFSSKHLGGDAFELYFDAKIDENWAIYSQHIPPDGPIPTSFTFDDAAHFALNGETTEPADGETKFDKLFEMRVTKFYEKARFVQKVKVSDASKPIVGYLEFMTCDNERCLPPTEVDFNIKVKADASNGDNNEDGASAQKAVEEQDEKPAVIVTSIDVPGNVNRAPGLEDPVSWKFGHKKLSEGEYELKLTAQIEPGWFIYSQHIEEGGPEPTAFYFNEIDGVEYIGETEENGADRYSGHDKIFDMQVTKYKNEVVFTQKIKTENPDQAIKGELEFMTCDDEKCLPPDFVEFAFLLGNAKSSAANAPDINTMSPQLTDGNTIDQVIPSIQASYIEPLGDCGEEETAKNKSLIWTFVLGFLGGLLALLTPCVFPMIPLTVSFFSKDTKRSGLVNGLIYALSIIVIYVLIGVVVTAAFGPTALNALSTNWIANTLFFLIFLFFAFSFFGFYEIQLPSRWTNKSDAMADKGGLIGIFFMAFTLALVSFSCTGPIIGSALVQSATSAVGPFIVMLGFSTALALPFGLFAAFPAWLNSLPKSGGWMNSVKVILGFLELALAFKFLSVADMTSHWEFLKYELFLGIWIAVAIGMALYLFGLIKFPHDSPLKKLSIPRLGLAVAMSALALYLMTGFAQDDRTQTYNALPMLSGLAPPAHYNFFDPPLDPEKAIKDKYPSYGKCANNLDCFKDYYEAVAYAKEVNKPLFVDFTGYGCVNCRKTEEHIWVRDAVWEKLKGEFVMVSLYVDDREALGEVLFSKSRNTKLRNVGQKWADFQIVNFEQNSQPLYVLMTPDERVLARPRGYHEGVQEYADFLECGLYTFENLDRLLGG